MGWGRDRKKKRRFIRVETQPVCSRWHSGPPRLATHGCTQEPYHYVCAACVTFCDLPLKIGPIYNSPLQKLGSWVFANKSNISGAPEDLLLAAYAHVEARMVRCAHGNARARATERWLGRWAKIIDRELEVQRHLAAYERDNFGVVGVALNDAPAGGLVEVEVRP